MRTVVMLPLLLLLPLESEGTCMTTGCLGCGSQAISCSAAELTEFPRFSAEDAALVIDLDLDRNCFSSISVSDLQNFTSLEELDLSTNNITYIEEGSFIMGLSSLLLDANPLHCDCKLRWLLDYLDSLPNDAEVDAGVCASPSLLTGSSFVTLNHSQLICECLPECGSNSSCDLSSGSCKCNPGYTGKNCAQVCPSGTFGLNCNASCICEGGSCHHITGLCTCFPDYYGVNCSHNCTGAPDCAVLGREECSLNTPEQTCGICHGGSDGEWGNSPCVDTTTVNTPSVIYTSTSQLQYSTASPESSIRTTPSPTHDPDKSDNLTLNLTAIETIAILSALSVIICLLAMLLLITLIWKNTPKCQRNKVRPSTSEEKLQDSSHDN